MKLYDLVKFRQRLHDEYSITQAVVELSTVKNKLIDLDRDLDTPYAEYVRRNIHAFSDIIQQVQQQQGTLTQFIEELDQHIELVTYELFSGTYDEELNRAMLNHDNRMARKSILPVSAKEQLINRLRHYSDWHYPGMELGCRTGELTEYLVANDPLYLVDLDQRFLDATASQFPELYQSRLRKYTTDVIPNFKSLPQNQFGFVFSWDFFNYLALPTIAVYLKELFGVLRPGGILLFTYNDGETPNGASHAENRWHSYVPKSKLIPLCASMGFEVIQAQTHDSGSLNWIELRKPGELKTVKASQAIGEIHHRFA